MELEQAITRESTREPLGGLRGNTRDIPGTSPSPVYLPRATESWSQVRNKPLPGVFDKRATPLLTVLS